MNKRIPAILLALLTAFTLGATACTVDADDEDGDPTIVEEDDDDDEDVDVDIDESP